LQSISNLHKERDVEMITQDLKHNVNEQDHNGLAALHWAVLGRPKGDDERHRECVKILLDNKADPELFSNKGWVPLHYAMASGDLEGGKVLLEAEANLEVQDPMGQTPLHRAVIAGKTECLRALLQCDRCTSETVNIKDDMGRSIMHWACLHNRRDMVTMCIKKGVNIGIVDRSGRLAEELAAQKGHRDLVKWLNEGAFPRSENPHLTRAAAAVKHSRYERTFQDILETLKGHGLEPEAATLEATRAGIMAGTVVNAATKSVPTLELTKADMASSAASLRSFVAELKQKDEETIAADTLEHICNELMTLAEEMAPESI